MISLRQIRLSGFSIQHGCRTMATSDGNLVVRIQFFPSNGLTTPDEHVKIPARLENLKIELGY